MADKDEKKPEGKQATKKVAEPEASASKAETSESLTQKSIPQSEAKTQASPKKTVRVKNRWRQVVPIVLKSKKEVQIRGRRSVEIPASEVSSHMETLQKKRIIEIS